MNAGAGPAIGGITPLRKLVAMCKLYGVKTVFQEGGENDPVNQQRRRRKRSLA